LYADRRTGSIERALAETGRRRLVQLAFNEKHGITPVGIKKSITDILEGAYSDGDRSKGKKVAEPAVNYDLMTPEQAVRRIKKLEQEMLKHARNLEFEQAAKIRDEVARLRNVELGLPVTKAG
jgi:excinuclease ABC subunit B